MAAVLPLFPDVMMDRLIRDHWIDEHTVIICTQLALTKDLERSNGNTCLVFKFPGEQSPWFVVVSAPIDLAEQLVFPDIASDIPACVVRDASVRNM